MNKSTTIPQQGSLPVDKIENKVINQKELCNKYSSCLHPKPITEQEESKDIHKSLLFTKYRTLQERPSKIDELKSNATVGRPLLVSKYSAPSESIDGNNGHKQKCSTDKASLVSGEEKIPYIGDLLRKYGKVSYPKSGQDGDNSDVIGGQVGNNSDVMSRRDIVNSDVISGQDGDNSDVIGGQVGDNSDVMSRRDGANSDVISDQVVDNSDVIGGQVGDNSGVISDHDSANSGPISGQDGDNKEAISDQDSTEQNKVEPLTAKPPPPLSKTSDQPRSTNFESEKDENKSDNTEQPQNTKNVKFAGSYTNVSRANNIAYSLSSGNSIAAKYGRKYNPDNA